MINAERFWSKVNKSGDCWLWTGSRFPKGYGQAFVDRYPMGAHRVSWILTFGEIPTGQQVLHHCDNPPCVRPDHLFLGTHKDNMRDRNTKKRMAYGNRSGMSKVTEDEVREILRLYASGMTQAELRRRYGLTDYPMYCIVHRINWKHISA